MHNRRFKQMIEVAKTAKRLEMGHWVNRCGTMRRGWFPDAADPANMNNNTAIRKRLWLQNPNCHYCGRLTKEYRNCRKSPEDQATLDHVYPRGHRRRQLPGQDKHVLSCYGCNRRRGRMKYEDFRALMGIA